MGKFERILQELNLIRANPGIKPTRLAQETGVTKRTIYRDVDFLSTLGIPVYSQNGYIIRDNAFLPVINLSPAEFALLKMTPHFASLKRSDYQGIVKGLLSKVEARLDPEIRKAAEKTAEHIQVQLKPLYHPTRILSFAKVSEKAIQNECKIKISYDCLETGLWEDVVLPYSLVFRNMAWHLLAYSEKEEKFIMFNLNRLKRITLLDKSFKRDPRFSVEKFLERKWQVSGEKLYSVKVSFKGAAAKLVSSTPYHPSEEISRQKDGPIIYSVEVEGLEEIASWILSFGDEAQVIQPPELREQIAKTAHNMVQIYSPESSSST